jgi:hypothetical protein
MKRIAVVLIALGLACFAWFGLDFAQEYGNPDDPLERLVDDLALIEAPAPGLAGMGLYSTFMAADDEPRFVGGVLGAPLPSIPPQMRELVRRGVDALPVLIRHLDDPRPTKLTAGDNPILRNREFGDECDPRMRPACDSECIREMIAHYEQFERFSGVYQVKIGDVRFVLVGQIVNRFLNAVRYQPSGNLFVNSPS